MFLYLLLYSSGRLAFDDSPDAPGTGIRPEEMGFIQKTVVDDDVLLSVLDVLRRLPRRVPMVMKLNDLTR
jgi:aarF domain-containing kinase